MKIHRQVEIQPYVSSFMKMHRQVEIQPYVSMRWARAVRFILRPLFFQEVNPISAGQWAE
jgi:hypothetical protein